MMEDFFAKRVFNHIYPMGTIEISAGTLKLSEFDLPVSSFKVHSDKVGDDWRIDVSNISLDFLSNEINLKKMFLHLTGSLHVYMEKAEFIFYVPSKGSDSIISSLINHCDEAKVQLKLPSKYTTLKIKGNLSSKFTNTMLNLLKTPVEKMI